MSDMSCFRTAPQAEKKAAKELRRLGIKAYVPQETVDVRVSNHAKKRVIKHRVTAPGYVCAKSSHYLARYVRHRLGLLSTSDLHRLYRLRRKPTETGRKLWKVGDRVTCSIGIHKTPITGSIKADRGRVVIVLPDNSDRTVSVATYLLQRPPA